MQFHLNGFRPGDPEIADPEEGNRGTGAAGPLPERTDVLIVGCGPAGLALAAQLAMHSDVRTCIIEQKREPLLRGQADGIACRTMEMFHAYGFAERVLREAYWVNETAFWKTDEALGRGIVRSGKVRDTEKGLSEFPHVILNQARVHDFFLEKMRTSPARIEPYYGRRLLDVRIDEAAPFDAHPVSVEVERLDASGEARVENVAARYVVGCDGARSTVRRSIGRELRGESANQAWGVMDVLAVTDFPDIRLKALIRSVAQGSVLIIPREGGYLVRLYVELDELKPGERVSDRGITADYLVAAAQRILSPYSFDVKEIAWWSVYEIGQRSCDRFDDVPDEKLAERLPRVFIAGDACHTHSPKAGQGMNVSMQDAFNLGWKLASVLRGRSTPALLPTYSAERQAVAKELIDFDREWAKMLSAASRPAADAQAVDPAAVREYFVRHGRYTAGTATRYGPSILTGPFEHQHLAEGFPIGARFHSAPVIRVADAKPVQLGHAARVDGRWRIYAFAGSEAPDTPGWPMRALCDFLSGSDASPLRRYTPPGDDIDSVLDIRAVFQTDHRELELEKMPALLLPRKGRYGLVDYEKMFSPDLEGGNDVFEMRRIDRRGCIVVVRPDQYVATVLPLDAFVELERFFGGFMVETK
ncbi:FAD-binding monooxygenase [Antarcticirhabdus aurantiaca]|uniref:FAD-binding monooxygenase n=1 Tax=Antarcticirhabdus aurantiaca TaxID=2606717 RepID=UPI00131E0D99|nr:FAD-binding monooxygenase [Antarcticirhabdus aurantiaca]